MHAPHLPAEGPSPAVVVDAGGEPWDRVAPLLARRLEELPATAVLALLVTDPGVRQALPQWCVERGHALDHGVRDGAASEFRISKDGLSHTELR
ncbi:hypothetical protein AB0L71_13320 [Streptomyces sp. NPDC052052]|uniref:sulfurtransferase TusA family protein n=1 Tax=Streptomyces sp. NPDC052052 TaxID=3154756 RepID=UPI00343DFADF